jgi:hypothetical protein
VQDDVQVGDLEVEEVKGVTIADALYARHAQ